MEKAMALAQQQQHQQQQQQQQKQLLLQQQQNHHHQQFLLLQQIQQQQAISRFPSNIDAHLRSHLHPIKNQQHPQNPNPNYPQNPNASHLQLNRPQPLPHSSPAHHSELQMAYQDAWRVCHPDFKRPFSSLEDACERSFNTIRLSVCSPMMSSSAGLRYRVIVLCGAEVRVSILTNATCGDFPLFGCQVRGRMRTVKPRMGNWVVDVAWQLQGLEPGSFGTKRAVDPLGAVAPTAVQKKKDYQLLPYHVVADYEAEEDDRILDSDTTGQALSRSQQWDHNIANKVSEFTATFEKQVLAFNIISQKRTMGEFRSEERLLIEQILLQEERRSLLETRTEMEARGREAHAASMRMAALAQAEQARMEMMARAPIRASALGLHEMDQEGGNGDDEMMMMNGWGDNIHEREPSEDFLNDEERENGDIGMQSDWRGGGEFDLNVR
ncbi:hypothetical protein LXL04_021517 [Taraxacum kok-saghyz]